MRTKLTLLAAALVAAGAASSMAQSVYSLNVVGYVNVTLPVGFSMISNPLNNGANNLTSVLGTNLPDGTTVFQFNGHGYDIQTWVAGAGGGWFNDTTMAPGSGCFIQNTSNNVAPLTFTGEVPQGSLANPVPQGFSVRASQVPQTGKITTDLGYPAQDGDTAYIFKAATHNYNIASYVAGAGGGWFDENGIEPTINVAQSFFISTSASTSWNRNFTVQ